MLPVFLKKLEREWLKPQNEADGIRSIEIVPGQEALLHKANIKIQFHRMVIVGRGLQHDFVIIFLFHQGHSQANKFLAQLMATHIPHLDRIVQVNVWLSVKPLMSGPPEYMSASITNSIILVKYF